MGDLWEGIAVEKDADHRKVARVGFNRSPFIVVAGRHENVEKHSEKLDGDGK